MRATVGSLECCVGRQGVFGYGYGGVGVLESGQTEVRPLYVSWEF
jgi:hypothetical protein